MPSSRLRPLSSSVGTKIVIGLSGLFLVLYLLIHVGGNLLVFFGPQVFNTYAYNMEVRNPTLPILEIIILIGFLIHIFKTIRMYLGNAAARPVAYKKKERAGYTSRKSFASSTMIFGGLWVIIFLIIHVKAFRFSPEIEWPGGGRDLYRQEMAVFANPLMTAFYIVSMLVVGSHLWHGFSSAFQSLGLVHARWTPRLLVVSKVLAVLIAGAFIVIAVWAYTQHGIGEVAR
jgi:succinate dehydrogenase / fumarate reductase, cytochrome b subunit